MCALRLSVKALRASRFERSTQPVKYRIESHIACDIAATIESQSLPDVRHRSYRNTDRNQNRSPNRFSMCATVAIGTQIESRIEQPIASRCAPPWRSEPRSKPESITQSLPDVRHRGHGNPVRNQNRAANRMPTRTENRHRNRSQIDAKSTPEGSK